MTSDAITSSKLLRILCLHGCAQNKDLFRQKIGSLRKALAKIAQLEFVESPHKIVRGDSDEENFKSWWFTAEDGTYVSKQPSDLDIGFRESVQVIENSVLEHGPYDGLMGFSQGATLAALICSMIEKQQFRGSFKFVILFAGFMSKCSPHQSYYSTELTVPSLHVFGDGDQVISKDRSEELVRIFQGAQVFKHQGGHYVPVTKEAKQCYQEFLIKFLQM